MSGATPQSGKKKLQNWFLSWKISYVDKTELFLGAYWGVKVICKSLQNIITCS